MSSFTLCLLRLSLLCEKSVPVLSKSFDDSSPSLNAVCKLTEEQVLVTVYILLLHRHCGEQDVVIGFKANGAKSQSDNEIIDVIFPLSFFLRWNDPTAYLCRRG